MAKFRCDRYPLLRVATGDGSVKFHDGVAEVTGEDAKALRALDGSYGVTEDKPKHSKSKSDSSDD